MKHKLVLVVLAVGIALFALTLPRYSREMGSASWPVTQGMIVRTNLVRVVGPHQTVGYQPGLQYAYEVNGRRYMGSRIDFQTADEMRPKEVAEAWLFKYPRGSMVRVYYNPKDPHITILEPEMKGGQRWLFYLGLAYIIGLSVAFVAVAYDLRKKGTRAGTV